MLGLGAQWVLSLRQATLEFCGDGCEGVKAPHLSHQSRTHRLGALLPQQQE